MAEWVNAGLVGLVFAVAGLLFPEPWLPWILIAALVLVAWTATEAVSEASTHWTNPSYRWLKDLLAKKHWRAVVVGVLVIASVVITRYVGFHTIELQTAPLDSVLPGDDVKLSGKGFPTEHPKILIASLTQKGGSEHEREAINKGVAGDVFTIGLPGDLDPGDYELTVSGPLALLWNSSTIDLKVLGKPEITSVTPAAGFAGMGGRGTKVVIRGKNFDLRNHGAGNRVFFGDAVAPARTGDAQECGGTSCIVVFVPGETPDGKTLNLTVETSSSSSLGKSDPLPFDVLGPSVIDQTSLAGVRGFARKASFRGSDITIGGSGFYPAALDDPGEMTVTIGGKIADIAKPPSQTMVTVRIPADVGPGTAKIAITTRARGGSTATGSIEILGSPKISDWRPGAAAPGETIDVVGHDFDIAGKDNNRVTIGGVTAQITGGRLEGEQSVLSVVIPGAANGSEIEVATPAGRTTAIGFQLKPIIDNIEPKQPYVGDTVFVHGRGILKDAAAWIGREPNQIPMRKSRFESGPDGQIVGFVVPQGAETGPITLKQEAGAAAVSRDDVIISRITELQQQRVPFVSRPIAFDTAKGTVELQVSCEKGLIAKGNFPGSPHLLEVGRCPIDLDVDRAAKRAYTANVEGDTKEGISEIDVSDPMNPKFLHHIDSGGANPTRVRILQGGGLVAATGKGIYSGNANGRMSSTGVEGPVVAMLGDPQEGQFVTVVLQAPPRVAVFGREGPPRVVNLKENPKTAARAGAKIYIVNYGSDSLSALDPRYPDKITPILLKPGAAPFDLAQRPQSSRNPDEIYVTETKLQQIAVVDPSKDAAVEFPAPIANATLVAFSPNGCVAVVYDPNKQALAKIDPKRRVVFDSIQYLPAVIQPPPVALRVNSALRVSLVLEGGTIMTPYQASCPR